MTQLSSPSTAASRRPGVPATATPQSRRLRLATWLLFGWIAITLVGATWWLFDPYAMFLALGAACCVIVTVPAARSGYSLFSPWTLVVIETYIGGGLRGTFLALQIDTKSNDLDRLFMQGQGPGYFVQPGALYVLGLGVMTAAFMLGPPIRGKERSRRWFEHYEFRRHVIPLAVGVGLVGATAFALYAQRTGGINLSTFSNKKSSISGLVVSDDYTSYGVYDLVNRLGAAAFWVVVAHYARLGVRTTLLTREGWILAAFAVNAVVMPVYVSSRTTAVGILLVGAAISLTVRPRKVPARALVIGGLSVLVLVSVMTFLRVNSRADQSSQITVGGLRDSAAHALVYNRNFGDMETAARVINNVPDVIPYQNGKTIVGWALAPIPRAIWPDKPVINVGPLIGYQIYGTRGSGVPPGFVGDLFLNFGPLGVPAGSIVIGWVLLAIDRWRQRQELLTVGFLIVYVPVAFSAGLGAISKGLGSMLYTASIGLVPVLVTLAVVGGWRTKRTARPVGQRR